LSLNFLIDTVQRNVKFGQPQLDQLKCHMWRNYGGVRGEKNHRLRLLD
jgi:hypothetical protein